jgi:rhamnosyltransferase
MVQMEVDKAVSRQGLVGPQAERVIAVVVSYNPQIEDFTELLEALLPQVAWVIIVDNASSADITLPLRRWYCQNIELLRMAGNMGIAAAQNVGIERALQLGADFVLLSDQDSVPSPGMAAELVAVITAARCDPLALSVAAVGPATVDSRTHQKSFFVTQRKGVPSRWWPPSQSDGLPPFIEVEFLIASGTLIPIEVFSRIGGMRSNYFIDHVDTEWCFRAKAAGYRLLGAPNSTLEHSLGDSVISVWFFGFRQVMYHSPLRDYYMFRNTILMLRDVPLSLIWRLHFLWRLVQFAGYFLIFPRGRLLRLRRMVLGLLHGLQSKSGRLEVSTDQCSVVPGSHIEPGQSLSK